MLPVKKKDVVLLFVVNCSRRIAVFVSGRRSLGEKSITTVCNMFDPRAYIDLIQQPVKLKLVLSTP